MPKRIQPKSLVICRSVSWQTSFRKSASVSRGAKFRSSLFSCCVRRQTQIWKTQRQSDRVWFFRNCCNASAAFVARQRQIEKPPNEVIGRIEIKMKRGTQKLDLVEAISLRVRHVEVLKTNDFKYFRFWLISFCVGEFAHVERLQRFHE